MLGIFKNKKNLPIAVGTRYQSNENTPMIWEVASLFQGIDGTPYAQIIHVGDTSRRKTVAQSALEQGTQYRRL